MNRFHTVLLAVACGLLLNCAAVQAADDTFADREEALKAMTARDPQKRAEAIAWIAEHGVPSDDAALRMRLTDENPFVRRYAEQALWVLWSRSGDEAIDALMEKGVEQTQAQQFKAAIATFSEVIRRDPAFAEGWNKRATVLFLAGDLRKSLADCDEVMKRNPYHFGALAGYGQIYFQLEQYEKAIEYWKRALRVNPNMEGVEIGIKNAEEKLVERRRRSAGQRPAVLAASKHDRDNSKSLKRARSHSFPSPYANSRRCPTVVLGGECVSLAQRPRAAMAL